MTKLARARRCSLLFPACCLIMVTTNVITRGQSPGSVRDRARIYEPFIMKAAAKHKIDARLLWTVAYLETRFQPGLISPKGARGLMQFMPATAARYRLADPHDPAQSIDAAARYLRDLQGRFGNRLDLVLAAYNAGEGAVEAYRNGKVLILKTGKVINPGRLMTGGVPPYRETRNYVASGILVFQSLSGPQLVTFARQLPKTDDQQNTQEAELDAIREDSFYTAAENQEGNQRGPVNQHMQRKQDAGQAILTTSIYPH